MQLDLLTEATVGTDSSFKKLLSLGRYQILPIRTYAQAHDGSTTSTTSDDINDCALHIQIVSVRIETSMPCTCVVCHKFKFSNDQGNDPPLFSKMLSDSCER
jgi:hypothetical protein